VPEDIALIQAVLPTEYKMLQLMKRMTMKRRLKCLGITNLPLEERI
jgi:hypothetical protein